MSFMAPIEDDPHPTCSRCRGRTCDERSTCFICCDLEGEASERYQALLIRRRKKRNARRNTASRAAKAKSTPSSYSHSMSPSPPPSPTMPIAHDIMGHDYINVVDVVGAGRDAPSSGGDVGPSTQGFDLVNVCSASSRAVPLHSGGDTGENNVHSLTVSPAPLQAALPRGDDLQRTYAQVVSGETPLQVVPSGASAQVVSSGTSVPRCVGDRPSVPVSLPFVPPRGDVGGGRTELVPHP